MNNRTLAICLIVGGACMLGLVAVAFLAGALFYSDSVPVSAGPGPIVAAGPVVTRNQVAPTPVPPPSPVPATPQPPQRSPYPEPDETIGRPLAPKHLAPEGTQFPQDSVAVAVVPWDKAAGYVGQQVVVEGKIVHTHLSREVCFLNFDREWKDKFYIVVYKEAFGAWPASPEKHFLNKTIQIRGEVSTFKGNPQVRVRSGKQITIIESKKEAAAG